MSYAKQKFSTGMTLTADHLNYIEDAIYALSNGGTIWYTDFTSTNLERVSGATSNGWSYALEEDLAAIRGVPINLAKFCTTSTSGTVRLGVAPSLGATTFSKLVTANFIKETSNKEVVTVQFDETIILGDEEYLVIEPYIKEGDALSEKEGTYNCYYGNVDGHNAFYSRIPSDLDADGNQPWRYYDQANIGWSFGYTVSNGDGSSVHVDNDMSDTSMNAVANNVIKKYVDSETSMRGTEYFYYDFVHNVNLDSGKLSGGYSTTHIDAKGYKLQPYSSKLLFKHCIDIDEVKIIADVELTDLTAILTLGSKTYTDTKHSSCATYNFSTKKIILAKNNNDSSVAAERTSIDFSSIIDSIDTNTRYKLEIGRHRRAVYAAVTNYRTGKRIEVVAEETTNETSKYGSNAGWLYDEPTAAQIGGTQAYLRDIRCYIPTDVKIAFIGDSITEGWGVLAKNCWANKCCEYFGNSINMGRSGARIFDHTIPQAADLLPVVKPKYVVVTIGTNDSETTTKQHYLDLIEIIEEAGATPIINYIFREKASTSAAADTINEIISSLNMLGARFDYATSIDNTLSKGQDASLFQSDELHPNDIGNQAIFERFITDCGFINFIK